MQLLIGSSVYILIPNGIETTFEIGVNVRSFHLLANRSIPHVDHPSMTRATSGTVSVNVQMFPVACRGCWMPGANEDFGYPRKHFSFVPQNLWRPFLVIHQNFHFFASVVTFHENWLLGCPPQCGIMPGNDIFLFFFSIYLHLKKLAPWMPPRADARGRHTVRTPLCTPLILMYYFLDLGTKQVLCRASEFHGTWKLDPTCLFVCGTQNPWPDLSVCL